MRLLRLVIAQTRGMWWPKHPTIDLNLPNSSTLSPKCSLCRKRLRSMRLRHCAPRCSSRRSCSTLLSSTCAVVLRCARCLASSCCFAFVCLCFAFLLCLFCFVLFCLLCCVELCVGVLSARARSPHLTRLAHSTAPHRTAARFRPAAVRQLGAHCDCHHAGLVLGVRAWLLRPARLPILRESLAACLARDL